VDHDHPAEAVLFVCPLAGQAPLAICGSADDTSVMASIAHRNEYEPHVVALVARTLSSDAVVLDIGANIGVLTMVFGQLAPRGAVHAFEPSSHHLGFLRRNLDTNAIRNATVHQLALDDTNGTVVLQMDPAFQAGAFVADHYTEGVAEAVPAMRLDEWVDRAHLTRVDLIKLDVEGLERRVLDGGADVIRRHRPDLIVECNAIASRKFHGESNAPLLRALQALYPAIFVIEESGKILPLGGLAHLNLYQRERVSCELFCTYYPERSGLSRLRAGRIGAVKNLAGLAWRHNRWRRPHHDFVTEPSFGLVLPTARISERRGAVFDLDVSVHNTSRHWLSSDVPLAAVSLSYQWLDPGGAVVVHDGLRTLIGDLRPGARGNFRMQVEAPTAPGPYQLRIDLVQEAVSWAHDLNPELDYRIPAEIAAF